MTHTSTRGRKIDVRGHDPDDLGRITVQPDGALEDIGTGRESATPEAVADDHVGGLAPGFITLDEAPAQLGSDAEHLEEAPADQRRFGLDRRVEGATG